MSGSAGIPSVPVAKGAASTKANGSASRQDKPLKRLVIHLLLALAALIAFFPILRVFSVALRPGNKLLDPNFTLIPENATLDAFVNVLTDPDSDLTLWLFNSLVVTIGTATIGVIIAATSAYAFSRYKFPGRGIGLTTLLATQLIPAAMLLVPIYLLAVQLKLPNTYVGLLIASIVNMIDPEMIVMGGGVVEALGAGFLDPIRVTARQYYIQQAGADKVRIVPAQLGDYAVVLGAAALVRQRAQPSASPR